MTGLSMLLKSRYISVMGAFLAFGCFAQSSAEKVDLRDLRRFGDAYLNQNVEVIAVITEAYQCKAAGNEGLVCLTVRDMQSAETILANPSNFVLGQLQRWAKDDEAIKFSGIVESRKAVDGNMYPSLMISAARVVPKTELTNPLNPNWVPVSAFRHVNGIDLAVDSRNSLLEGKMVSMWTLIDYDRPQRNSSGKPFLSEVRRYKFKCTGSGIILSTSQYEERRAAGRKVSGSLEKRDVVVEPKTIEAALFEYIAHLCPN